ncbi:MULTISPECIES: hypothetical protein [unclassified Mesorhizobium]|uniref:hypothetical protein n=1 Tax=unclassified Mesorhizobium TaxID=325217 RepID=UPI00112D3560|nr:MULTISPECIES: hypothetical protein [unclassified Mesorhizobium]TPK53815.1 hypothetical protein FJ550_09465 [Mesorhizobium sp. B2-5-2]TPL17176.1 hypothetical protein FJ946_28815 [Mesorhizobium sp. B2-4-7]TPL33413.1 hypothetical protein FJ961_28865 [Mesorhizobium sp. B2-4-5]TPM69147.1 hypothetical protein FJ968_28400 [Mesorhizobium sp. B2-1-6]TPN73632.1 hypothetical protein FJ985_25755 [Mesorhizobium sp. B1-1-2]
MRRAPSSSYGEFASLPIACDLDLDSFSGPAWEVRSLRYRSGWLMVSRATMETSFSSWTAPLIACIDDDGESVSPWLTAKFFELGCSLPRDPEDSPPVELEWASEALYWDFLGACDLEHLSMFEQCEVDLDRAALRLEDRGRNSLEEVDDYIGNLRRWLRVEPRDGEQKARVSAQIDLLERKQMDAQRWMLARVMKIREARDSFEAEVMDALCCHGEIEHLYTMHWNVRHGRDVRDPAPRSTLSFLSPTDHIRQVHIDRDVRAHRRVRWRSQDASDTIGSRHLDRIPFEERRDEKLAAIVRSAKVILGEAMPGEIVDDVRAKPARDGDSAGRSPLISMHPENRNPEEFLAEMERKRAIALRHRERSRRQAELRKTRLADELKMAMAVGTAQSPVQAAPDGQVRSQLSAIHSSPDEREDLLARRRPQDEEEHVSPPANVKQIECNVEETEA